jgi:hypothetical protein
VSIEYTKVAAGKKIPWVGFTPSRKTKAETVIAMYSFMTRICANIFFISNLFCHGDMCGVSRLIE